MDYLSDPTILTQVWWDARVLAGDTVTEKMIVCVKKDDSYGGTGYDPTADADSTSVCSQ